MRAGDPSDEALLGLVAEMLDGIEPVSPRARELANGASQMAALHRELAALVYDSHEHADLVLTRSGEGQARLMSFANDHLTLEISLLADGRSLVGEIDPAGATELVIERRDGDPETVPVDEFGRFRAPAGPGAIRLRVVGQLITPWIAR
jgi:hypothetical protein